MFQVDGYLNLDQMIHAISTSMGTAIADVMSGYEDEDMRDKIGAAWIDWTLYNILESATSVYLYKPGASIVAVNPSFALRFPTGKKSNSIHIPECTPVDIKVVKRFHYAVWRSLAFVDPDTGLVFNGEIHNGEEIEDFELPENKDFIEIIKDFKGFAVLMADKEFGQLAESFRKLIVSGEVGLEGRKRPGRTPLAVDAAIRFKALYPNGKGNTHWSTIEDQIGVSSKTIKNGLKLLEGAGSEPENKSEGAERNGQ